MKSLDNVGTETSSSVSALSAFSCCKFWLEDIAQRVESGPNAVNCDNFESM